MAEDILDTEQIFALLLAHARIIWYEEYPTADRIVRSITG